MENGLNTLLIISLVLVTGCVVTFLTFLIYILSIVKRILTKVELRIDNFELTQEELKLKLLTFIDEVVNKIIKYIKKERKVGENIHEKKD